MNETLTDICKRLEHFETPEWAAKAILKKEILTAKVFDPCAGIGILVKAASEAEYDIYANDIYNWGGDIELDTQFDFLKPPANDFDLPIKGNTIFMNPPFSLAQEFVDKSFELGARKIVCFQRFAWWESKKRKDWWQKRPPNRIYICSDRADCWRHDIPADERGSGSPTAHAWFVWEAEHPGGTVLGHISKSDAE